MKTDTEEKEYLNNLIPIKEYESVIKNLAIARRYNNYKYICTQHRSTAICKANTSKYERGN